MTKAFRSELPSETIGFVQRINEIAWLLKREHQSNVIIKETYNNGKMFYMTMNYFF